MLSVCIITKNEQDNLKECLTRLKPFGFEIVVVDTGSTDASREIAESFTSAVYDFAWCDDFSAARNFAISKASNEYIFMLDTDEFIESLDEDLLVSLIRENPDKIGRIHRKNPFEGTEEAMTSDERISRIFSKGLYHYEGRIHEQLTAISNRTNAYPKTYDVPVYTLHYGYIDRDTQIKKANRNLKLLLEELAENEDDAYLLYQIGKSYHSLNQYEASIPYFERAISLPLDLRLEYVQNMVVLYGYALINTKQYEKAMLFEGIYDDFCHNADFLFVMGLIYMYNAQFQQAVESFLTATTIPSCNIEGVNSYRAYYNVGVILECLGDRENACSYYEKCGTYPAAAEGLIRCRQA